MRIRLTEDNKIVLTHEEYSQFFNRLTEELLQEHILLEEYQHALQTIQILPFQFPADSHLSDTTKELVNYYFMSASADNRKFYGYFHAIDQHPYLALDAANQFGFTTVVTCTEQSGCVFQEQEFFSIQWNEESITLIIYPSKDQMKQAMLQYQDK